MLNSTRLPGDRRAGRLPLQSDSGMSGIDRFLVRADGFLPKERYTTDEFAELELERLWPRVWQIAGPGGRARTGRALLRVRDR